MTALTKVLFRTDGLPETGFGHLSRCIQIAKGVLRKYSEIQISFCGSFSTVATNIIIESLPDALIISSPSGSYDIAVIDTMFDYNDIEYYNESEISKINHFCAKTLLICSSRTIPEKLDVDLVVAYVAEKNYFRNYRMINSLEFSPVAESLGQYRSERREIKTSVNSFFIGIGGWSDLLPQQNILNALASSEFSGEIHVLVSPLLKEKVSSLSFAGEKNRLHIHCQLPDLGPLLQNADVALLTYGNLMFECLAMGVPSLVVGVKDFQVEYANYLEEQGLVLSLGNIGTLEQVDFLAGVNQMNYNMRKALSINAMKAVDTRGVQRITDIVVEVLRSENRV